MHVLGIFLDSGLVEHWPDLALTALLAFSVWLLQRWISANENRHLRAEEKFEDVDENIADVRDQTHLRPWRHRRTDSRTN